MSQMKMIAVASGKGGVGKSTVAINLALCLATKGKGVGLLDADIYGPSQPMMLGTTKTKPILEQGKWQPIERHGLQSMSMGYLVEGNVAMMWRGPMLGKALEQMLNQTAWQNLDYLIIDLPPGTGDIQLTLCQKMGLNGAIMVTTPQELALSDARRAAQMFRNLNVPLLGVIENMSHHICSACGHAEHIFNDQAGVRLAQEFEMPFLGAIPLAKDIHEMTDHGTPLVIHAPDSAYAEIFQEIAKKILHTLSLVQPVKKFPKVVIERTNE